MLSSAYSFMNCKTILKSWYYRKSHSGSLPLSLKLIACTLPNQLMPTDRLGSWILFSRPVPVPLKKYFILQYNLRSMEGESELGGGGEGWSCLSEKCQKKPNEHILYNMISFLFHFLSFVYGVAITAASKPWRPRTFDPALTCHHKVSWPQSPHYSLDFEEQ